MPTAAKLVAAIAFAIVAALAAHLYVLAMPDGRPAGYLREISGLIGAFCGWMIMGPLAGGDRGRIEAMGTGVRTSLTIAILVVLVFSIRDMLQRSMKGRYDAPMDAILGIFEQALELGSPVLQADIIGVLLLGGLMGGAISHWAGRTWR